VVEVNPAAEDFAASNGQKMPLYLLRNVKEDMTVMREENLRPRSCRSCAIRKVDEAIDYVNRHDRPLGPVLFSARTRPNNARCLDRTVSGGVTVNDVVFHAAMDDLPFGGIGPFGHGQLSTGEDGFKKPSAMRASVYKQPKMDVAKLAGFKPPYGSATRKAIRARLQGLIGRWPGRPGIQRRAEYLHTGGWSSPSVLIQPPLCPKRRLPDASCNWPARPRP